MGCIVCQYRFILDMISEIHLWCVTCQSVGNGRIFATYPGDFLSLDLNFNPDPVVGVSSDTNVELVWGQ